ncbi:MAG: 6-carboxytetrahydropterin synthase [Candidatus Omnitrophica bacterium]|nr:6-carboxytetrahydropterin synthase [Candidatus Omnitrophota bacterium]
MYRVTKEINFCYGHRLLNYEGKCRHLHGHNGRVLIELEAEQLDSRGMVVDFGDIKRTLQAWIDENLDHKILLNKEDPIIPHLRELNEAFFTMNENPTAEAISRLIFEYAVSQGLNVIQVTLWETPTSYASFCPAGQGAWRPE